MNQCENCRLQKEPEQETYLYCLGCEDWFKFKDENEDLFI